MFSRPLFCYSNAALRSARLQPSIVQALKARAPLKSLTNFGFEITKIKRAFQNYTKKTFGNQRPQYNTGRYYKNIRWEKLIRPAAFTVAFCVGTTILVPPLLKYTPLAIFRKNSNALVYTIIGLNVAVFFMWRMHACRNFLNKYAIIIKDKLPSQWSMLGAAFSHQTVPHLLINMFVLQSFGTSLCAMIGVSNFLVMYLNAAVISSFFSLLVPVIMRSSLAVGSLGASGAIFAVFGTFSYLIPKAPIAFFFIPVPGGAWYLFLGSIIYNIAGIGLRWGSHDFAAHIGGCVAGLAYGFYFNKIRERIMKQRRRSVYF